MSKQVVELNEKELKNLIELVEYYLQNQPLKADDEKYFNERLVELRNKLKKNPILRLNPKKKLPKLETL